MKPEANLEKLFLQLLLNKMTMINWAFIKITTNTLC